MARSRVVRTPVSWSAFAAFVVCALAASLGLTGCGKGCGGGGSAAADGRLRVVVSIFPLHDLVKRVAGPDADVDLLLPPGQSEHRFDPSPRDVERASRARLGVMVGLGLDPWMEKLLKDAAPSAKVVKVGDRVPTIPMREPLGEDEAAAAQGGHGHDHGHDEAGGPDPHVWLDPQRALLVVQTVGEELAKADAAHAADYRARAAELGASLKVLDAELERRTAALPRKDLVTFHGSFGYFADRYQLRIVAVIEPFPGSQPTGEYVTKVLAVVRSANVPALFREPQLDPRPAKVLADEAKIPLGVLDPVGGGPETGSYEALLRTDMAQLEQFLK